MKWLNIHGAFAFQPRAYYLLCIVHDDARLLLVKLNVFDAMVYRVGGLYTKGHIWGLTENVQC